MQRSKGLAHQTGPPIPWTRHVLACVAHLDALSRFGQHLHMAAIGARSDRAFECRHALVLAGGTRDTTDARHCRETGSIRA